MAFIRAEAATLIHKWKQVAFGGLIFLAGAYWAATSLGLAIAAGVMVAGMGVLIAHDGYRRMRFPHGVGGAGVVEVDERQITYLSGTGGNSVSLDMLQRVEAHRNMRGSITWVFFAEDGMLNVPADAQGSEALFDAMVALPGVNYAQAEAAAQGQGPDLFLIWQRDRTKLH